MLCYVMVPSFAEFKSNRTCVRYDEEKIIHFDLPPQIRVHLIYDAQIAWQYVSCKLCRRDVIRRNLSILHLPPYTLAYLIYEAKIAWNEMHQEDNLILSTTRRVQRHQTLY